jgi:hypothetical protein
MKNSEEAYIPYTRQCRKVVDKHLNQHYGKESIRNLQKKIIWSN